MIQKYLFILLLILLPITVTLQASSLNFFRLDYEVQAQLVGREFPNLTHFPLTTLKTIALNIKHPGNTFFSESYISLGSSLSSVQLTRPITLVHYNNEKKIQSLKATTLSAGSLRYFRTKTRAKYRPYSGLSIGGVFFENKDFDAFFGGIDFGTFIGIKHIHNNKVSSNYFAGLAFSTIEVSKVNDVSETLDTNQTDLNLFLGASINFLK